MIYEGQTLSGQVELDGNRFVNCQFHQAKLIYRGGRAPQLLGCMFDPARSNSRTPLRTRFACSTRWRSPKVDCAISPHACSCRYCNPERKRLGAGRQHSRPDRRRFPDERRRTECRWIIGKKTAEDGPQAGRSVGFSDGQPGRAHANLPGSVTGGPLTNCRSGWPTSGNSERSDSRAFFGGMDVIMGWLSIATS